MKKKSRDGKKGISCEKLITVSLEKNSSHNFSRRDGRKGKDEKRKKCRDAREGAREKGGEDGRIGLEGAGSNVDVNKGDRISFRRTAILPTKGCAATSSIHKEAA